MHITVKKTALVAVLTRAAAVAPKKPSIPILSHVLLQVNHAEGSLLVSATDLEISIQIPCDLIATEKLGAVALPAQKLKELVEVLPDAIVELRLLDNFRTEITSGEHVSRLAGMDPSGFPQFSTAEEPEYSELHADELHQIIAAVSHAICEDATRPHLSGIFFRADQGLFYGVAIDGHRVSVAGKRIDGVSDSCTRLATGVIVPRRGVDEIKCLPDRSLDLCLGKSSIDLIQGDSSLLVRLVDGQYPDWRHHIPKNYTSFFTVDSAVLINAVNRVRLLAHEGHIQFTLAAGTMLLHARSADNESLDSVSYTPGHGDTNNELAFRLNSRYLLDALKSLGGLVVFKYQNENSPFLLLPADYGRWDERMELVMPLRL